MYPNQTYIYDHRGDAHRPNISDTPPDRAMNISAEHVAPPSTV